MNTQDERLQHNALFLLCKIAGAKRGETVAIIQDDTTKDYARALAECALSMGLRPLQIDISPYAGETRYTAYSNMPLINPLRAAIEAADICLMTTEQKNTDFSLFLHDPDACDISLLGENRRYTVDVTGMEHWEIDEEELLQMRQRTRRLVNALKRGRRIHVTTALGTDFAADVGTKPHGIYPVLGIVPLYGEVAVVPSAGGVTGKLVVDGASQFAYGSSPYPIRPHFPGGDELERPPLLIELQAGKVVRYDGDAAQVERLRQWMYEAEPYADMADEVGLVTTRSLDNDRYHWLIDGTHQSRCVHVALGNANHTNTLIHGKKHIDFDMHAPTITLDGLLICQDGIYLDDAVERLGAEKP
ncbi:MAG: hypothetical protein PHI98_08370 [Eubacteriales bacterium]|nr:hypothetical protein [Eubacteriales bacterium]